MAKKKMTAAEFSAMNEIVSRDRPGYCVVSLDDETPSAQPASSDVSTRRDSPMTSNAPNLEYLRRKFRVPGPVSASASTDSAAIPAVEDAQIIQIAPTTDTSRAKRKAIVISGKKITGEQG